ncbi:MAG: NADH-quinone oxidoreductase subunit M [Gemmataceae bacterium]
MLSFDHHVLLWLLTLPLISAIVVWCLGPNRGPAIRGISFVSSLIVMALAAILVVRYLSLERKALEVLPRSGIATFVPEFVPGSTEDLPHATTWNLLPVGKDGHIQFFLGVDGLNLWLIALTALLMLPSVLVSFRQVTERVNEFYAWLLALQTCMLGVFLSFDIVLFYVFFEVSLIPLFFLIGIWGGSQRQYAARKFFIYTLAGSLITLLGVLGVVIACYTHTGKFTFAIPELVRDVHLQLASDQPEVRATWNAVQMWTFLAMALGFAIKVPLLPFHTWLPLAHVEAPTAGSVDLAGVLLKIGSYGFLRLCIPLAPDFTYSHGLPLVTWLAAIGVVYGAFCAYAQDDVKRLIAYSSVSHLGLCMLGMFSLTAVGIQGSLMQMINHGLSTAALFLLIGMLYERYHTRQMRDYSGMATRMPLFGVCLVFACLSSVGLPLLNGFIGEFLCLAGIYQFECLPRPGESGPTPRVLPILTFLGALGLVMGAWYLMTMLRKVLFGPLKEPPHEGHAIEDLTPREWGLLTPIFILCVVIGFYPHPILKSAEPDVDRIALVVEKARERAKQAEKRLPPGPARADARQP